MSKIVRISKEQIIEANKKMKKHLEEDTQGKEFLKEDEKFRKKMNQKKSEEKTALKTGGKVKNE
ncbi:MAG: hypothetical protein FK731_09380 [Asgard group archaeon]|nr:hypothetical protein [Asgard group archaeon]